MTQFPPAQSFADMYCNITDTHAHYNSHAFAEDMDEVLSALPQKGVIRVINCATDVKSGEECVAMSEKYPFVYFTAGIHAQDCNDKPISDLLLVEAQLSHPKCVGIGEIGLEYHYDCAPKEKQILFFEEQVKMAVKHDLPVVVHDREAHGDTLEILKKHRPKGVLHCFSGSVEMAREILALGMYIGLGGAVTFKNAKKPVEVAKYVPSDRLLLETDCPYMTPVPLRGQRNLSSYIPYTAELIANLRNVDTQALINTTTENANTLFGLNL